MLVLALQMCSGRRLVKVVGTVGMMAGCGLAAALLRAHLREAALALQQGEPEVCDGSEDRGPKQTRGARPLAMFNSYKCKT